MLNSLCIAIPVAILLGFLSGLGTGGGSLLILWLTLAVKMPHSDARLINLMFFIPSAVIACLFRWKEGKLNIQKILPGILAGCGAALLCSWITAGQTPELLKKIFGGLLVVTGIRELCYQKKG